jgi:hypothetical protein
MYDIDDRLQAAHCRRSADSGLPARCYNHSYYNAQLIAQYAACACCVHVLPLGDTVVQVLHTNTALSYTRRNEEAALLLLRYTIYRHCALRSI